MSSEIMDLYEFGGFRIDRSRGLLLEGGQSIPVPPKAFETLLALVERDGGIISKEDLMARVWPGTFVEENNLTQQISLLRKLLHDASQTIIETVPRRGYRVAAEITRVSQSTPTDPKAATPVPAPADRLRWRVPAIMLIVLAVIAIAMIVRARRESAPRTIAVLPFKPLVKAGGDVYLELGMADALITELSSMRDIRVRPTSAVLPYAGATDAMAVGRQLSVDAILDGRIQRSGNRIRVTAQLVRVSTGSPLWAGTFDEDFDNILAVQDAIASRIAAALALDLTGEEPRPARPRMNAEAYQLYLRGRYSWYQWTPEGWERARDYFEQAVAKDPRMAIAWSGLADAIGVQNSVRNPAEVAPRAKAAALRAVELDKSLPDPYASLGAQAMFYGWDRAAASRYLRRAIALSPNHALSHDLLALLLASEAKFSEAIVESQRARDLDPGSPYMNTDLGSIYYFQRDNNLAERHVRAALAINPDYADAFRYLASIEEQRNHPDKAIAYWAKVLRENGDPEIATAVQASFASSGFRGAVQRWLDELTKKAARTYVSPYEFAELHARLGNREEAFMWLRRAADEHAPGLFWLAVEPRWDAYRRDARFRALLKEMNRS